jgi:16S rRNA (guanine966-N2)-methyltransferase
MMRIITGTARGVRLDTLDGDMTRPTTERAKEAVFSILRARMDFSGMRVLDLFAGCGQLGLEALSAGAAHAVLVDQSREAVHIIERNAEKTHLANRCTILCSDTKAYLHSRRGRETFNCIFLDPPYAMHAVATTVEEILRARLLVPGGLIVCESGEPDPLGFGTDTALSSHFILLKEAKYGKAYITLAALPVSGEK